MNCREYIIEFEERGSLSESARLHLTVCADCRKTSARQTQIWRLIEDFKPVAAPTDFDFHVKARIAQTKPSDFQKPSLLPILRYVLPLSVAVLLLGIFVFNSSYFSNAPTDSQTAQSGTAIPAAKSDLPTNISSANQLAFALSNNNAELPMPENAPDKMVVTPPVIDEKIIAGRTSPSRTRPERKENVETSGLSSNQPANSFEKRNADESGLGSRVLSGGSPSVLFPKDTNPNQPASIISNANQARPISDEQILDFFGIQTAVENGRRTVKSLTKNDAGERSGIKIGDVIEKVNGNSLTILRGAEKLEISLR